MYPHTRKLAWRRCNASQTWLDVANAVLELFNSYFFAESSNDLECVAYMSSCSKILFLLMSKASNCHFLLEVVMTDTCHI